MSEAYKRGRIKEQTIYIFWFWRGKAALLIRPGLIRPGLCSPKDGDRRPRWQGAIIIIITTAITFDITIMTIVAITKFITSITIVCNDYYYFGGKEPSPASIQLEAKADATRKCSCSA